MLKLLARFILQAWCRILHGHVMVKFGSDRVKNPDPKAYYMCARCLRCEVLHDVPEEAL